MFSHVACSIKVAGIVAVLICHVCAAMADGVANVTVELYIETLCPYCSKLMNTGIKELLHDGIFDIADVTVVPSVRAHVGSDALLASFPLMSVIDFPHDHSPKACPTVLHKGRPVYMLLLLGQKTQGYRATRTWQLTRASHASTVKRNATGTACWPVSHMQLQVTSPFSSMQPAPRQRLRWTLLNKRNPAWRS